MAASTPRQLLLDALTAGELAAYRVIPYARDIDVPDTPTILVRVDAVAPARDQLTRTYTFALLLVAAQTADGAADDELDELLEDVLHALGNTGLAIVWTTAKRGVWLDPTDTPRFPLYEVTVEVTTTHERD